MKNERECGGVGYPGVQRGKAFLCSLFGMFKGGMVQQMELHLEFLAFVCYVPRHPEMTTEFSKNTLLPAHPGPDDGGIYGIRRRSR